MASSDAQKDQAADHCSGKQWEFNESVTASFDDMLARSIPEYDLMRDGCCRIARAFMPVKDGWLVDLGASRGEASALLIDHFGARARYTLVEVSEPMLAVLRERFAGMISAGLVEVLAKDLRHEIPERPAHVILSVLTLQFVPINYRQQIVQACYDMLRPGGAMILVEKVLGEGAEIDQVMVTNYHAMKHQNGYSYDQIDRKRESLEGVLVPVTAQWNVDLLRSCGFRAVDCFWRWMNFAAWVAIKRR